MASPFAIAPLERAEAEAALRAWAHSQEPLPDREITAPPEVDDGRDTYDPRDALCRAIASPVADPHDGWE